jgi:Tfp pilus assembly protein PilF
VRLRTASWRATQSTHRRCGVFIGASRHKTIPTCRRLNFITLRRCGHDATLVSAAINLAIVYEKMHKDMLARKYYNEAVRVAPRSFAARYNRGQFLQKHGELEAARSDYQVALEIKPDEASLYINLAAMELRLFETKLDIQLMAPAEKNLKQAERLKSKSPALYFNRARLFELYNFPARARTAYREAMRYYPETSVEYQTCQTRVQRLSMQLK